MFVNISGYKFVTIYDTQFLRMHLTPLLGELGIKGTITLSPEGLNIGVSGTGQAISQFVSALHQDKRFADMVFKASESETIPFMHLFVKCKAHIVPAAIEVDARVSKQHSISPQQLKAWLDAKEEVVLIDTRNDYEIRYGTFAKAQHYGLNTFKEIYPAFQKSEALKKRKVVMFCTGGIRCEKGVPLAKAAGFEEVYQLEGGILQYFEECGAAHYEGACYVFDERTAVLPSLQPLPEKSINSG